MSLTSSQTEVVSLVLSTGSEHDDGSLLGKVLEAG